MKILVTGAKGFIGSNLLTKLRSYSNVEILEFDRFHTLEDLSEMLLNVDIIYHLAGVNRPKHISEFQDVNVNLTKFITSTLITAKRKIPIIMTSSIQVELDNEYGHSKKEAENELIYYSKVMESPIYIYRLPNVFGKWCRPFYNSAIATFCYQISRNEEIYVSDSNKKIRLIYIDDLIKEFVNLLDNQFNSDIYYSQVFPEYVFTLGEIVEKIRGFELINKTNEIKNIGNGFDKKLYSTYLSYVPHSQLCYPLETNYDNRGSFTELLKTIESGQISINITKPGFIKGNHWHHTKVEKFLVLSGDAVIRLRQIHQSEIIEFFVSEKKLEVVDIPVGYTHHIENIGQKDLITLIWSNECFNKNEPDTHYLKV